jgi:hypothetical protein
MMLELARLIGMPCNLDAFRIPDYSESHISCVQTLKKIPHSQKEAAQTFLKALIWCHPLTSRVRLALAQACAQSALKPF